MNALLELVRAAKSHADILDGKRTIQDIFVAAQSEMGELADEITIASGRSYKSPGKDGIKGEALDAILSLLDLILVEDPTTTQEELLAMAQPKLDKWVEKLSQRNPKP